MLSRSQPIKQSVLRDALAEGLATVQGAGSDQDAADMLGWSAQTVRNVRNRHNTVSMELACEAQRRDIRFLAKLAEAIGQRIVPLDAKCDSDPAFQTHLMAVAFKVAKAIETGGTIDDDELADMLPDLRQLSQFVDGLIARAALKLAANQ